MKPSKFLKKFIIAVIICFWAVFLIVWYIDPFYHFHAPFWPFKVTITKGEYQGIGSIRNFDYDSILLGSSVAENYNNRWFDEGFNCTTIKGIKSSGTTADLLYLFDEACEKNNDDIKYCFYSLDLFALMADPDTNFTSYLKDSLPLYLYDHNPFNDLEYIYNKDVLFEAIPTAIYKAFDSSVDEGETYSWYHNKEFSKEAAIRNSDLTDQDLSQTPLSVDEIDEYVKSNLENLIQRIKTHPDTEFIFILPPYSSLWRENMIRCGEQLRYEYAYEAFLDAMKQFDNVKIYSFMDDINITDNLDNYMDAMHFSYNISGMIASEIQKEDSEYRIQ